jgi:hypothetical protein
MVHPLAIHGMDTITSRKGHLGEAVGKVEMMSLFWTIMKNMNFPTRLNSVWIRTYRTWKV